MSKGTESKQSFNPKIILVDDEEMCLKAMELTLKSAGFKSITKCQDGRKLLEIINANGCDLVVLDIMMPNISGIDLFKNIRKHYPHITIIMASGVEDVDTVVDFMKNGARDYILKPLEPTRFVSAVKHSMEVQALLMENQALSQSLLSEELSNPQIFEPIITCSEKMYSIFRYIEAIAPTQHSVLIIGETGVGKELVAKSIHDASARKGEFVALNVAGLDDAVFTDTLFGHVKGSFTGADSARKGLVEKAAGGTLFLDEIGDSSLASQVKLLRLLQEKEYLPLGSDIQKQADTRIIAATCKKIEDLENPEAFRKDLYFRLKTHYIKVPPLRERKEDIKILFNYFLDKAVNQTELQYPLIPNELYGILAKYDFTGNVRELEGMVYDCLSHSSSGKISIQYFHDKLEYNPITVDNLSANQESSSTSDDLISFSSQLPTLKECSNMLIQEALSRTEGNLSQAASILGITRQALGQRLNKKK